MKQVVKGNYLEKRLIKVTHLNTGTSYISDVPAGYGGDDSSFSPTEMVVSALSNCMATVMLVVAEKHRVSLAGMWYESSMEMADNPRRIGHVQVEYHLPASVPVEKRNLLEKSAHICPVKNSLNPEMKIELFFHYDA